MAKSKIDEIRIRPDDFGGHTVHVDFRPTPNSSKNKMAMPSYVEPEKKVFGKTEGHDMLAHVANHLEIPTEAAEERKLTPKAAQEIRAKANGR